MESSRIQVIPAFAAKTSFNTPGAPEIFPKRAVEFVNIRAGGMSPRHFQEIRMTRPAVAMALLCGLAGGAPGALAQPAKVKVGLMLPYSGTYAALGTAIENGFRLYVAEQGGRIAGREIEDFEVEEE